MYRRILAILLLVGLATFGVSPASASDVNSTVQGSAFPAVSVNNPFVGALEA